MKKPPELESQSKRTERISALIHKQGCLLRLHERYKSVDQEINILWPQCTELENRLLALLTEGEQLEKELKNTRDEIKKLTEEYGSVKMKKEKKA